MSLQFISSLVGIPIDILRGKCLRHGKNPNGNFNNLDLDFFKSDYDDKNKMLLVASKINFEDYEVENYEFKY